MSLCYLMRDRATVDRQQCISTLVMSAAHRHSLDSSGTVFSGILCNQDIYGALWSTSERQRNYIQKQSSGKGSLASGMRIFSSRYFQ